MKFVLKQFLADGTVKTTRGTGPIHGEPNVGDEAYTILNVTSIPVTGYRAVPPKGRIEIQGED